MASVALILTGIGLLLYSLFGGPPFDWALSSYGAILIAWGDLRIEIRNRKHSPLYGGKEG